MHHPAAVPFLAAIRVERRGRPKPGTVSDGDVAALEDATAAFCLPRVREDMGRSSLEIDMDVMDSMRASVGSLDGARALARGALRETLVSSDAFADSVLFGPGAFTLAATQGRAERGLGSSYWLGRVPGSGSHAWLTASVSDIRFLGSYSKRLRTKPCPKGMMRPVCKRETPFHD